MIQYTTFSCTKKAYSESFGGNTSRTARKLAKGAEHAVSQLDKMVDDFVERRMDG